MHRPACSVKLCSQNITKMESTCRAEIFSFTTTVATHPMDTIFVSKVATFLCIIYVLKCVTDMVLYNICGKFVLNTYMYVVLRIFVPKRREGSRGRNITFSLRTQGGGNGLSYISHLLV